MACMKILGLSFGVKDGVRMSIEEIAKMLEYSVEKATRLHQRAWRKVMGVLIEEQDLRRDANEVVWSGDPESLNEQEETVIRLRLGLDGGKPLTLRGIGERFGVTKARIHQIEKSARAKLQRGAKLFSP